MATTDAPAIASGADRYARGYRRGWAPDPRLTVSEWADRFRILGDADGPEPGQWRTSRTPYLREIQDSLGPRHPAKRVVFMGGSQLGKTQAGNNWVGYTIHQSPATMLMVQANMEVARRASQLRVATMIEATAELRELVSSPRSRDASNSTFMKQFPGGFLAMTWANSPAGLKMLAVERLFFDEADEYHGDVGGQGDPVKLGEKRSSNFTRRKCYIVSTPTTRDASRIEKAFQKTDQRRFFVPCPVCGAMDWIQWTAGGYRGDEGVHHNIVFHDRDPDTAHLECSNKDCRAAIAEESKTWMLERGEWRPTRDAEKNGPADPEAVGYHLSGLYSPYGWRSWREATQEFLEAKDDPFLLKTWVNTVPAETFQEEGDVIDLDRIALRTSERYPATEGAEVPHGAGALILTADVQGDRIEVQMTAFGDGEESWLLAWEQLHGDPGWRNREKLEEADVWRDLETFARRQWVHESGQRLSPDCLLVDTGGLHTDEAYTFVDTRRGRLGRTKVFAIKGGNQYGMPMVSRPSTSNRYKLKLYTLGVSAAKDTLLSRLRIVNHGPGYIHLDGRHADQEYLEQLTAERARRKYVPGKGSVREWVKVRDRNEALDLTVYALCGLRIMGSALTKNLAERARRWSEPAPEPPPAAAGGAPAPPAAPPPRPGRARPRSSWATRW